MKTIEISFKKSKKVLENITSSVLDLCDAYRRNGQIYKALWPIAEKDENIKVFVNTPESDSLNIKYASKHVKKQIEKLIEVGLETPEIKLLGFDNSGDGVCSCENSSFYYLRTGFEIENESPLRCGECKLNIPLYKIPKTSNFDNYEDVLRWQYEYVIYDTLHILSTVGEKLGYNQISNYDSVLSQNGIELCKRITELTGKPVYYYLYKYYGRSNNSEMKRKCPSCHGEWFLDKPLVLWNVVDFKCDKCLLISNIGWDVRTR